MAEQSGADFDVTKRGMWQRARATERKRAPSASPCRGAQSGTFAAAPACARSLALLLEAPLHACQLGIVPGGVHAGKHAPGQVSGGGVAGGARVACQPQDGKCLSMEQRQSISFEVKAWAPHAASRQQSLHAALLQCLPPRLCMRKTSARKRGVHARNTPCTSNQGGGPSP